ncbi:MAG: hypothetical protein M1829_001653 [Trizodia sp. TS-e1964]|nr:MAG: hypothetical protein M1829_001653 [Trizodia sp. TS-e1964]
MEFDLGFELVAQPIDHRRQQSLEAIFETPFPEPVLLQEAERAEAQAQFTRLLDKYRQEFPHPGHDKFNVALLVQLFYDFALLQVNKDNILRHFLGHVASVPKGQRDRFDLILTGLIHLPEDPNDTHCSRIREFAEAFVSSLIVPRQCSICPSPNGIICNGLHAIVRAIGGKTPVMSPIFSPDASITRVGTGKRSPSLQDQVAMRDRHRCAISGAFSSSERKARRKVDGLNATDDDGVLFTSPNPFGIGPVDTAHIIPHSIGALVGNNDQLNKLQLSALNILNIVDSELVKEIEGIGIDRPRNALLLTKNFHDHFGQFDIYFDKIDKEPNTYIVRETDPEAPIPGLPRTVKFEPGNIELPSPRLLAIHKSLARMMYLTGAAENIDQQFRDGPDINIAADGTTDLGALITVGLFSKASVYVC